MAAERDRAMHALPYRGAFGDPRPASLAGLAVPPQAMPSHDGTRPLKAWRYVGVYGPEIMLCIGSVRVGPLRQSFWAVWDRVAGRLRERTVIGPREVGPTSVRSADVQIDLALEETEGVETISRSGDSYAWTRKQGGTPALATLTIDGHTRRLHAHAVIDDSAGYHERHTAWRWCAGVGRTTAGQQIAWNLVEGVHDAPVGSERTVWVDGEPHEVGPCSFEPELRGVAGLRFEPEAVRERRDNLLLVRSRYRQPFGTFSGELPGGLVLADGYGVMESHQAWW